MLCISVRIGIYLRIRVHVEIMNSRSKLSHEIFQGIAFDIGIKWLDGGSASLEWKVDFFKVDIYKLYFLVWIENRSREAFWLRVFIEIRIRWQAFIEKALRQLISCNSPEVTLFNANTYPKISAKSLSWPWNFLEIRNSIDIDSASFQVSVLRCVYGQIDADLFSEMQ